MDGNVSIQFPRSWSDADCVTVHECVLAGKSVKEIAEQVGQLAYLENIIAKVRIH